MRYTSRNNNNNNHNSNNNNNNNNNSSDLDAGNSGCVSLPSLFFLQRAKGSCSVSQLPPSLTTNSQRIGGEYELQVLEQNGVSCSSETNQSTTNNVLPYSSLLCDDLLFSILSFFDEMSLCVCSLVCHQWYKLIECGNQPLWKQLFINCLESRFLDSMEINNDNGTAASDASSSLATSTIRSLSRDGRSRSKRRKLLENMNAISATSMLKQSPLLNCLFSTSCDTDDHHNITAAISWKREYLKLLQSIRNEQFWTSFLLSDNATTTATTIAVDNSNTLMKNYEIKSMALSSPPRLFRNSMTDMIRCVVRAESKTCYKMFHEQSGTLLLIAHMMPNSHLISKKYSIHIPLPTNTTTTTMSSLDSDNSSDQHPIVGYLQSSKLGLQFDLSDTTLYPNTLRVCYQANFLGFGGYNKLHVAITDPSVDNKEEGCDDDMDVTLTRNVSVGDGTTTATTSSPVSTSRSSVSPAMIESLTGRDYYQELYRFYQLRTQSEKRTESITDNNNGVPSEFKTSSSYPLKQLNLTNRPPVWNAKHRSWSLDFGGRVKVRSVKNFQLMESDDNNKLMTTTTTTTKKPNYLLMGRINSNTFALDYRYPFNALQAFCVALSALDHKLACP